MKNKTTQTTDTTSLPTLQLLDVEKLDRHPRNRDVSNQDLAGLAEDIAMRGVIDPLTVRVHPEQPGRWQIISGERRWRASRMAGLAEVPCIVRELDERAARELLLVPNLEREDLTPLEESEAVRALVDVGLDGEELCRRIHRSQEWVQLRLGLALLPEPMKQAVEKKTVSLQAAAAVLAVPVPKMEEAMQLVLHPTFQKTPLSGEQARAVLAEKIIKPQKERDEWEAGAAKRIAKWKNLLATDAKVGGNKIDFVHRGFADPLPSGHLMLAVEEFADEETTLGADVVASGAMFAARLGHPVFIVPARRVTWLADGQHAKLEEELDSVALVDRTAIEEADAAHESPLLVHDEEDPHLTREDVAAAQVELCAKLRSELEDAIKAGLGLVDPFSVGDEGDSMTLAYLTEFELDLASVVRMLLGENQEEYDEAIGGERAALLAAAREFSELPGKWVFVAALWFGFFDVVRFNLRRDLTLDEDVRERLATAMEVFEGVMEANWLPTLRRLLAE